MINKSSSLCQRADSESAVDKSDLMRSQRSARNLPGVKGEAVGRMSKRQQHDLCGTLGFAKVTPVRREAIMASSLVPSVGLLPAATREDTFHYLLMAFPGSS